MGNIASWHRNSARSAVSATRWTWIINTTTTSVRAGIQPFISDFRGFIFSDTNLGVRLFGNYANNRYQFNAAYFYMLEKDTNSELNTPHFRDQTVFIANLFRQDTVHHGYTTQFSFHYNDDRPTRHFDENDFLVRPALIGDVRFNYNRWANKLGSGVDSSLTAAGLGFVDPSASTFSGAGFWARLSAAS